MLSYHSFGTRIVHVECSSLMRSMLIPNRGKWIFALSALIVQGCTSQAVSEPSASLCTDSLIRAADLQVVRADAVPVELRVPGEIVSVPEETTELRSAVNGSIREVYVRAGDAVQKGMPLCLIRSPQLLEWEAKLRATQAQIEAQKLRTEAMERMGRDSLVSTLEVRTARAELLQLQAEKEQLSELLQLFQRRGPDFVLIAPRSGTVLAVGISSGANVEVGDFLFRLADLSKVRFQVYLYPEQFLQAKVGMSGEATLPGWTEHIRFQIQQFLPALNEETRAITAFADLPNPDRKLLPGAFFQAKLRLVQTDSAISVPVSAVILDADQRYVLIYRAPCDWDIRPVEVIRQTADRVYLRGIMPHETVATRQVLFLYQQLTRSL